MNEFDLLWTDDEMQSAREESYQQGRADALTEIITHIKACENEAYDNCEPLIGSVLMATRIKAEQLKEQSND